MSAFQEMEKMLVIVVDGSLSLNPYWDDIKTVLDRIVRRFCMNNDSTSSDPFGGKYFLNFIAYGAENASPDQPIMQYSWAPSMESFLQSLSCLTFTDASLSESTIIEGFSKALMMFPSTRRRTQAQLLGKRHCVLVTASSLAPRPKEVLIPKNKILESGEVDEVEIGTSLESAETIVCSFLKSFVTFSMICPSEMSTLRTMFDAVKFTSGEGSDVQESFDEDLKHPQLLLLISEQFHEARVALKEYQGSSNDTNRDYDPVMPVAESFQPEAMPLITDDEMDALQWLPLPDEDFSHQMPFPDNLDEFLQDVLPEKNLNVDDSNNLMIQERSLTEHMAAERNVLEGTIVIVDEETDGFDTLISKKLWPLEVVRSDFVTSSTSATRNEETRMVNLLHSQQNDGFGKLKESHSLEGTTMHFADQPHQTIIPQLASWSVQNAPNGMVEASSSKVYTTVDVSQLHRGDTRNPLSGNHAERRIELVPLLSNATSGANTASNFPMPQYFSRSPVTGIHASRGKNILSTDTLTTSMNASGEKNASCTIAHTTSSMMDVLTPNAAMANMSSWKDVLGTKALAGSMNSSGMKDVLSTNAQMATMDTAAAKDVLPNSSAGYLEQPQFSGATSIPPTMKFDHNLSRNLSSDAPPMHIKGWEGFITSRGAGVTLYKSRLVAYRKPTVPEKIFDNWPKMMQLTHLVPEMYVPNRLFYDGKQCLTFSVLDFCPTWDRMKSLNLCAYVDLLGQTLILSVSKDKTRLLGTLCEGALPVYRHQIFKPYW